MKYLAKIISSIFSPISLEDNNHRLILWSC